MIILTQGCVENLLITKKQINSNKQRCELVSHLFFFPRKSHLLGFKLLLVISLFLFIPLISQAQPPPDIKIDSIQNKNPGTDLWRSVRQREVLLPGRSQIRNVESGILINAQGDKWTRFRSEQLNRYGLYVLMAIVVVIVLFYLVRGRVNIEGGLSGKMVARFSHYERSMHWVMAIIFLFLAITGLILLLGRPLLIPVMGKEVFSILASSSKEGHNLMGPLFAVSVLLMFFQFVKRNIYARGDLTWLLKGGGFLGKGHVTGGFFNMGEKTWYWIFILVGLAISVSGLILVFPNFGQGRVIMELSHVVHGIGAIILMAISIGHMYLGSIGSEGSLESMKSGYVDIKWAEAHHDRWAKECHEKGLVISAEEYAHLQGMADSENNKTASVNAGGKQ